MGNDGNWPYHVAQIKVSGQYLRACMRIHGDETRVHECIYYCDVWFG